jgi:hypothetical protein
MPDPQERRAAARFPVNMDSSCGFVLPVVDDYGPARIQNISTDGVGLILSREVAKGTILVIDLTNKAQNFSKTMLLEVMHATKQVGGTYLVGGAFLVPLTYEEMRRYVM